MDGGSAQINPVGRKADIHIPQCIGQREIRGNHPASGSGNASIRIPAAQQFTDRPVNPHIDIFACKIVLDTAGCTTRLPAQRTIVGHQRIARYRRINPLQRIEHTVALLRHPATRIEQYCLEIHICAAQYVDILQTAGSKASGFDPRADHRHLGIGRRRQDAERNGCIASLHPGRIKAINLHITRAYRTRKRMHNGRIAAEYRSCVAHFKFSPGDSDGHLVFQVDVHRVGLYLKIDHLRTGCDQCILFRKVRIRPKTDPGSVCNEPKRILRHIDQHIIERNHRMDTGLPDPARREFTETARQIGVDADDTVRHNPFLLGRKQFGKRTEIDRAVHVALDPGVPQHIPRRTVRPEFHSDSIDRKLAQDHTCGIGTGRMVKQRRIEQQIIDPRPTPPITEVTAVHFAIEPDTRQYTAVETVRSRYLRLQVSRQVGFDTLYGRHQLDRNQAERLFESQRIDPAGHIRHDTVGRHRHVAVEHCRDIVHLESQLIKRNSARIFRIECKAPGKRQRQGAGVTNGLLLHRSFASEIDFITLAAVPP